MSLIEAKDFSFSIQDKLILEHIDLEVPEESFFSIIGPNGAGKSIFVKCLLGQYDSDLKLFNRNIKDVDRLQIGYVPQKKAYQTNFPARAKDLIANGLARAWPTHLGDEENKKVCQALEQVHALKLADQPLRTLSGGELQRVYLARAVVRQRKLIILDEPATGIDTLGESDLYALLEDYQRKFKASILMVTHDIEVARFHSDYVMLLNRKMISSGKPEDSLTEDCLKRAFGHSQHAHGDHSHA